MPDPSGRIHGPAKRLDSWKAIAAYFQRDVRTVQRWERSEGLPVHRHPHEKGATVHAYEADLERWWRNRSARKQAEPAVFPKPARRNWLAPGAAIAFAAGLAAILLKPPPATPPEVIRYSQLTSDGRVKSGRVVTDGSRIYFLESIPGAGDSLASVPVKGGETALIPTSFSGFQLFDVSARRSEFLLAAGGEDTRAPALWTLPLSGGTPHRLADLAGSPAAWSGDGERLAYAQGSALFVARANGDGPRKLATVSGEIAALCWSPDNRRLRLSFQRPDRWADEIWEIRADGAGLHAVLQGWDNSREGFWTQDGKYFLFIGLRNHQRFVYALREGDRGFPRGARAPVPLASTGLFDFQWQVPSPDGRQIFALGSQHRPEMVRYDSKMREFVPYLHGISAYWADLSRDGRSLAYISLPQHALWRAKPDGSGPVQLTFGPLDVDGFAWSPDSTQIAIRAREPDQKWQLYLIPAAGGAPRTLTSGADDAGNPSWSPDGTQIVFGGVPAVQFQDDPRLSIRVLDVATGRITELPHSAGLWTSRWSPDGRAIAAMTLAGQRLAVFDLAAQKWRSFDSPPVNNLTWSHEGAYIYFDSIEKDRALYRLRVRDGRLGRIAGLEGSVSTLWGSGLAPDDSPLVTRDVGFTEIYALDLRLP